MIEYASVGLAHDLADAQFTHRQQVRRLTHSRVQGLRSLRQKTRLSVGILMLGVAGAVTGFVYSASTRTLGDLLAVAIVCVIIAVFATANIVVLAELHRGRIRYTLILTANARNSAAQITLYEKELIEARAREDQLMNIPNAVDEMLRLIAAAAGPGNPQLAAIAGTKLTDQEWAEVAAENRWDETITQKLRDANASLHRARRS